MNIEELRKKVEAAHIAYMGAECMSRGWDAGRTETARQVWLDALAELRAAEDAQGAIEEAELDKAIAEYRPLDMATVTRDIFNTFTPRPVPTNPATPGFGGGSDE